MDAKEDIREEIFIEANRLIELQAIASKLLADYQKADEKVQRALADFNGKLYTKWLPKTE